ncbi:MAG: energy-coupling factor ABC transporter permease [Spirochaetaceae bacterium]|nr:energy-coupling factor ABC transporter permease [Spirochaetaceae bacterium]
MHMADALISPAVGAIAWAATGVVAAHSVKKIQNDIDDKKIPLMGVMGAFVFAAQMINFSIPGTGSSGHLGGGLLLSVILGPYAGFLSMASVLLIQALFFADGGLLAFGCNVFNLGFFTCFVAYPFVYGKLARPGASAGRKSGAALLAAVLGLQLGAFAVVLETLLSGKTELPFGTFALLMQPIHLAIGLVEGLVTAAIVAFVAKTSPEILERADSREGLGAASIRKTLAVLGVAALLVGGVLSWFASAYPDGLEWSMEKVSGGAELEAEGTVHKGLEALQEKTAVMPDYGFKTTEGAKDAEAAETGAGPTRWPAVDGGTSVAGLLGGALTLALAALAGLAVKAAKARARRGKAAAREQAGR